MGKLYNIIKGLKPMMMMVMVQVTLAGANILYKLEGNNGMSMPILIAYRFIFAMATAVPLALILDRNKRPKMTWKIIMHAFVCALFGGSLAQNLYAKSLVLTSATFVAAITNLIPALTLILAVIFRMEALGLKTMAGKAKLSGTVLGIGGAMLLTFYKGFEVNFDLFHKTQTLCGHVVEAHHNSTNSVLGLLLALASCFSLSFSLIVQTKMSQIYPCYYSSTALISISGSVQAIVYALCIEKDGSKWKLGWNLTLITAAYMGILASGIMSVFTTLCVRMRGPLYVSVFNPLVLVLVAIAGSLFLNEKMHLGSLLGGAVIVCGLYLVLWGKDKEMKGLMASNISTISTMDETVARESFSGSIHANNVVVVNEEEEEEETRTSSSIISGDMARFLAVGLILLLLLLVGVNLVWRVLFSSEILAKRGFLRGEFACKFFNKAENCVCSDVIACSRSGGGEESGCRNSLGLKKSMCFGDSLFCRFTLSILKS